MHTEPQVLEKIAGKQFSNVSFKMKKINIPDFMNTRNKGVHIAQTIISLETFIFLTSSQNKVILENISYFNNWDVFIVFGVDVVMLKFALCEIGRAHV